MPARTAFHFTLLGVVAYMTHRSSTPPMPTPKDDEVRNDVKPRELLFGRVARRMGDIVKSSVATLGYAVIVTMLTL